MFVCFHCSFTLSLLVASFAAGSGDQYEGMWAEDKKHGPGRYFYMSTRKMYEGEWVNDVAKCGVFSDIPPEFMGVDMSRPRAEEDAFKLPEVCAHCD